MQMQGVKIHGADFSRAQRSHWALRELGLDATIERVPVPIDVRTGAIFAEEPEKAAEYRLMHPDARMPVLATPGNEYTLFESLAINYYLAKEAGGPLAPEDTQEEARVMQWSIWVIANCEDACVNLSFAGMMRDPEKAAARKAPLFEKLARPFAALDAHLSRQQYLLGDDRWSIADLNVAAILDWGVKAGMPMDEYPHLGRWVDESFARPAYLAETQSPKL